MIYSRTTTEEEAYIFAKELNLVNEEVRHCSCKKVMIIEERQDHLIYNK